MAGWTTEKMRAKRDHDKSLQDVQERAEGMPAPSQEEVNTFAAELRRQGKRRRGVPAHRLRR